MCPSISAISDRSFRGSVNYCMPMVLNIKEHEQFFKKCVQKMLTTAVPQFDTMHPLSVEGSNLTITPTQKTIGCICLGFMVFYGKTQR